MICLLPTPVLVVKGDYTPEDLRLPQLQNEFRGWQEIEEYQLILGLNCSTILFMSGFLPSVF